MCLVVYLASDQPLPFIAWDENTPAFHVTEVREAELKVRQQFKKPHLYYLGSHTGCGCGFDDAQNNERNVDEHAATERTLNALGAYLAAAVATAGTLELYSCWDGDQGTQPDCRLELSPASFGAGMKWLAERTYVRISDRAA